MNTELKGEMWFISCLLSWMAWCAPATAASFDCTKANTTVEKLICVDSESSGLDDEMAALYKGAMRDKVLAAGVRSTQKEWLKVRNGCADVACVRNAYLKRIQHLLHVTSIDQRWRACFADRECSARAKTLVPLYAKENGTTESDVIHVLNNCETPDRNMGSCMSYGLFELRYELREKIANLSQNCDDSCGKSISSEHAKWLENAARTCRKQVEGDMEGRGWGLEAQERMLACEFRATESRLRRFLAVDGCSPVKKCLLGGC